jgi:predicted MPP superfamily phosphohydrolase
MDADLVAITGDFVENVRYLDWVREVLSRVQSRYGVYYVLGNHDKRLRDAAPLRRALSDAGLIDLGGRWVKVEVRGEPLILAGNELPWFRPPAPMEDCPGVAGGARPLRVLLAHTPDQLPWARSFDFDLMLAGHTHGGQIRFPIIGPLVVPSRYGAKYAAGAFYEDPTLLHVTRGVSSLEPLRFRCPPELARLVLQIDPSVVHVPFAEEHGQTC